MKIKLTLRKKILILITLLSTILFLAMFLLIIHQEKRILKETLIKKGINTVKNFALSCENSLVLGNELEMEDIVDVVVKERDVINAYVVLPDMTYYLHNNQKYLGKKYIYPHPIKINLKKSYIIFKRNNDIIYQFSYPIYKYTINGEKKIFGFAYVEISTKFIHKEISKITKQLLIIFFSIFLLGIILTIYLTKIIVTPIKKFVKELKIIEKGNLRHKIKIHTNDEIDLLVNEFNIMTEKLYKLQKNLIQQKIMEQELEIARDIQNKFIPQNIIPVKGYNITTLYKPSRIVSGDYFNLIKIKNKYIFIIADISGKGIPAALLMSVFHTLSTIIIEDFISLENTVKLLNKHIKKFLKGNNFITMLIGEIGKNSIKLINSGHEFPLLINLEKKDLTFIKHSNFPLGMFPEKEFNKGVKISKIRLNNKNALFIYTDGLKNLSSQKPFNNIELKNFLTNILRKKKEFNSFYDEINNKIKKRKLSDDITLFFIRRDANDKNKKR